MQFAAKFVRLRSRKKACIRREAEILKKVRGKSPHILEFQEAYERGRNLIIITELYVGCVVMMAVGRGMGPHGSVLILWVWLLCVGVVTLVLWSIAGCLVVNSWRLW